MKVRFNYIEDELIGETNEGTPMYANQISLSVLGQDFVGIFEVVGNDERKKAKLFGMKLQELGKYIERQASHGTPCTIWVGEKEVRSF